jgi:hypothetical protein
MHDSLSIYTVLTSLFVFASGEGMNKQNLKDFATFALDQGMRDGLGKDFISKFGVGAKQAGFYIGDRISITTRRRGEPILQFVMDEERFRQRSVERDGSVFRDSIVVQGEPTPAALSDTAMQQYVSNFEREHSHFTIIMLKMRPHILVSLKRHPDIAMSMSKELADIYHFHLHPNDLPDKLVCNDRFKKSYKDACTKAGKGKKFAGLEPIAIRGYKFTHVASANANSKLEMSLEVWLGRPPPVSLKQSGVRALEGSGASKRIFRPLDKVRSAPYRLMHAEGAYPFRFNLSIPDPRPEELSIGGEAGRLAKDKDVRL